MLADRGRTRPGRDPRSRSSPRTLPGLGAGGHRRPAGHPARRRQAPPPGCRGDRADVLVRCCRRPTGVDEATVRERLHDLARRDYLRPSRGSRIAGQAEYTFGHALIADVAYAQLPRRERARHHQAVADWHATRITDPDTSSDSAVVAHHYLQAHQIIHSTEVDAATQDALTASAATWHTHAAEHARHSDAPTALNLAHTAVGLTPRDDPQRPDRLILLGKLEASSGQHGQAEATYEEAHKAAQQSGNNLLAADAQVHQSHSIGSLARRDEANALLASAISVLEQQPPGPELVFAYLSRAWAHQSHGRMREAREAVDQASALVDQLDVPPEILVEARLARGEVRIWSGDTRGSRGPDPGARARRTPQPHQQNHRLQRRSRDLERLYPDRPRSARLQPGRCPHCSADRPERSKARASANLADNLLILGRLDEAFSVLQAAADVAADSPSMKAWLWTELACLHLVRGDLEQASALIARAWPDSQVGGLT